VTARRLSSRCHRLLGQLAHHARDIHHAPVADERAVGDPKHLGGFDGDVASCCGDALKLAVVRAGHRRAKEDTVALCDELIQRDVEIGKCLEVEEAAFSHPGCCPRISEVVAGRVQISPRSERSSSLLRGVAAPRSLAE